MPETLLTEREQERLEALRSYNVLDTTEEQDFDELTMLASAICQTPIALISLVDEKRQWFKSHTGTDISQTPIEQSFCAHAIVSFDEIMIVNDATKDSRFSDNPLVTGGPKIVFYAGVPLTNKDGHSLGTLCVIDSNKKDLTQEQTDALKILAKQVVDKLELRRKLFQLERANKELREANVFIQKFASMAAHDIKNPISSVLLTSQALKLRLQKLQDSGCEKLIDHNISATKNLMTLLDEMLAYSKSPATLLTKKQSFDLKGTLRKIITLVNIPGNFNVIIPEESQLITLSLVAFEQIFINLISNAVRYNDKDDGYVAIRFSEDEDYYRFEIEDNGIGIAEQYHEKIFSNNFTLKITDRYKGTGIGLSTVKELIKVLQGSIHVSSKPGEGATFFISIRK